ncbi:MAG: 3'-5' exonuclease, partial [Thermodesulfobacteriota bacterium]
MRVLTIHSFCGMLLRRFSFEASLDPNYKVEDAIDSRIVWEKILYEILMEAGGGKAGHDILLQALSEKGFSGLNYLRGKINDLYEKCPFSLEAEIPNLTFNKGGIRGLVKELKNWAGAKEAINDYRQLFEEDSFYRIVTAEKYFLTQSRMLRKRPPGSLKGIVDYQGWAMKMFLYWKQKSMEEFTKRAGRIKEIFTICFNKYRDKKTQKGTLDFSDLEYIAYKLLTENPEWSNVLYAFDEKTDHILVDEFQDTNNFQWAIIDRLTEEWRSGIGAKREKGIMPTVFLVGDEKQSIYLFRGANVEIFHKAKEKLEYWLKNEFHYEEVKENFRSLPSIIDFTNHIFTSIMSTVGIDLPTGQAGSYRDDSAPSWVTRYSSFEARRDDTSDTGTVELILLDNDKRSVAEVRQKEADVIAKRIQGLVDNFQINDRSVGATLCSNRLNSDSLREPTSSRALSQKRPCRYMDIALLLRKRTHLKKYEEAFRQHNIPFVAVKGIGFYQEPEIAILRSLVYFLSNPKDDYSLYVLLKSPFFLVDEGVIIKAMFSEGVDLLSKIKAGGQAGEAVRLLEEWLSQALYLPVAELIEGALIQTKAWEYFYEEQRRANVKKFIRLVEDLEAEGKSLLKIRDFLERTDTKADEPKANVNTEGMDAVRIMTIHGSKGLEFPIVFIPGLEESVMSKSDDSLIYEAGGKLFFKYIPDLAIRKQDEDFLLRMKKEEEEQKRLFYVAVTRAEEALFLVGQWRENSSGFLGFLQHGLGIERNNAGFKILSPGAEKIKGFAILSESDVDALYKKKRQLKALKKLSRPAEFIKIETEETPVWKSVTETVDIKRRHGKDWVILGDIIHRLFEGISKGFISEQDIKVRA